MEIVLPDIQLRTVLPHIVLVIFACALPLLPLFFRKIQRDLLALIAIAGLFLSFFFLISFWNQDLSGFGGMVIMDNFALAFSVIFVIGGVLAVLLSLNHVENEYLNYGDFYGMLFFALVGMMWMVSSTHLLVIFLGLEVLSISLYVLAGIRKMRADSVESSLKYFLLGAFATGFFLYGVALLYGATGSLDLVNIRAYFARHGFSGVLAIAGTALLLIGFSFKAAFVPFHMWTPDVYQGAPTPVTAFMSSGAKGAALAALLRVIMAGLPIGQPEWNALLWMLAVLTMTVGNILAIVQSNVKRMLAYSSIAHAGYLLVGVLAASKLGQTAVLFYMLVYTFMNLGAFGVISYFGASNREEHLNLEDYRGLGYKYPFASLAMAIFMFSLAGVPPTGGFAGKFYLFNAAVQAGYVWLVIIAVLNSVISAYYYLRVVVNLYMRDPERDVVVPKAHIALSFALILAIFGVLQMGILPAKIFHLFQYSVLALK